MPTLLEGAGCQAGVGSALVAGAQIAWRWPPSGELPVVESDSRGGTSQDLTDFFFLGVCFFFTPISRKERKEKNTSCGSGGRVGGCESPHINVYAAGN